MLLCGTLDWLAFSMIMLSLYHLAANRCQAGILTGLTALDPNPQVANLSIESSTPRPCFLRKVMQQALFCKQQKHAQGLDKDLHRC